MGSSAASSPEALAGSSAAGASAASAGAASAGRADSTCPGAGSASTSSSRASAPGSVSPAVEGTPEKRTAGGEATSGATRRRRRSRRSAIDRPLRKAAAPATPARSPVATKAARWTGRARSPSAPTDRYRTKSIQARAKSAAPMQSR
ncbi:MAG: hypothetical protein D6729_14265 [Deltaproteobacteria bacterium]|nr:MAG: hypothetical protein D6729_14265 [Deltaproteobacteria bacterium]